MTVNEMIRSSSRDITTQDRTVIAKSNPTVYLVVLQTRLKGNPLITP